VAGLLRILEANSAKDRRAATRSHHFHKIDLMRLKQEQGGWDAPAPADEKRQPQPNRELFFVPDDEAPLISNG
jgi:hypothetical protein